MGDGDRGGGAFSGDAVVTRRQLVRRVGALLGKRRHEQELNDEILAHLELAERDAMAEGLSSEQARLLARRRFGGIEQMKEHHRDQRSIRVVEIIAKDFRYGLAALIREPGFALVTIGILAIGIGANTAMFSLVDAVLMKPLPFPEPDRIVRVWETPPNATRNPVTTMDFIDWKRLSHSFTALAAERNARAALTGDGEPKRISGKRVSADYFQAFAVQAHIGRTFAVDEDQPGAEPVVVLSHAAWYTHFGGDARILDREIVLDGTAHRVVGVLPAGVFDRDSASFWMPMIFTPEERTRGSHWLRVVGRLNEGVSLAEAREEMRSIDESLTELSPTWKQNWGVLVEPFDERLVGDSLRQSIVVAFGAVALVLLLACANVANLLLAKGANRKKEMAVRAALGATRGRLLGQLVTESVVLCLLGSLAGVALAFVMIRTARPLLSPSLPVTADVTLDLRVLGYGAAVAVAVCLLIGLLPSLSTSFGKLSRALNDASRGSSRSGDGLRRAIVVGEFAVSLVLVCGALLMLKSLSNLQHVETGVRVDNVITLSIDLPLAAYPTPSTATGFFRNVVERVEAAPAVARAALSTHLPFAEVGAGQGMFIPGTDEGINVRYKRVDSSYFAVLGIPVVSGRGIEPSDREDAPRVWVVNEELARRLSLDLGATEPVGQLARVTTPYYVQKGGELVEGTIVGVIRNERVGDLAADDRPVLYVPLAQAPTRDIRLLVESQADPSALVPSVRDALKEIDANLPLGDVQTMHQVKQRSLAGARHPTWIVGAFAAIAAFLAALGMYGVLSYAVAQQRREIGIRVAFGAGRTQILTHVLRSGVSMIFIGLVLGLIGTLQATTVLESLLFQVSALDPFVIVLACASMLLVGLLAGFVPASRAAHVDPMTVLREEG